jgi:hypothetical protein
MVRQEPRNFECPETESACIDERCTKQVCCKREAERATTIRGNSR